MIIDCKKYSGKCICGKTHIPDTKFCVIESGCMKNINQYLNDFGFKENIVAIYDENTYKACEHILPQVYKHIILSSDHLHADNRGVELALAEIPIETKTLLAIGSGTIHDITRYCANKLDIPFVSCPTAASVDGFCSSVAAMTWNGFKKTIAAVSPAVVIADIDIISKAPINLAKSGFGDMVGKYIALAEWKISNILTNEYFCPKIYDMTKVAADNVIRNAVGILSGDTLAYESLVYGLILSGLAMQLLGNSRCASGAEHHISHLIEMEPKKLAVHSEALHGEKVGVATLLVCREYHRIKEVYDLICNNYKPAKKKYIENFFGEDLYSAIIEENSKDSAQNISGNKIKEAKKRIIEAINEIPQYEILNEIYKKIGVKNTLEDIEVPSDKLNNILEYSPLVRNRVTLMRIRRGCS